MATQRLHDACFASAVEGDIEPVYWQGIKVGHVREFDSRLRIEMLRARMPDRFKAPGSANVARCLRPETPTYLLRLMRQRGCP